jgi:hypothetical protein
VSVYGAAIDRLAAASAPGEPAAGDAVATAVAAGVAAGDAVAAAGDAVAAVVGAELLPQAAASRAMAAIPINVRR